MSISQNKNPLDNDGMRILSAQEIKDRLDKFNENTNDWSVFDDVGPLQHVDVMYPHRIDFKKLLQK